MLVEQILHVGCPVAHVAYTQQYSHMHGTAMLAIHACTLHTRSMQRQRHQ
jgi:hypothetical protein